MCSGVVLFGWPVPYDGPLLPSVKVKLPATTFTKAAQKLTKTKKNSTLSQVKCDADAAYFFFISSSPPPRSYHRQKRQPARQPELSSFTWSCVKAAPLMRSSVSVSVAARAAESASVSIGKQTKTQAQRQRLQVEVNARHVKCLAYVNTMLMLC